LLASLEIIAGDEGRQRRQMLAERIAQWRQDLKLSRWQPRRSSTAIQPVIIGDNEATMVAGRALRERGYWVGSVRPPTVPTGTSRLRVTLSAAHTEVQLDGLMAAIADIER
jgi:8-amino-7-oxononanoate synthase